MIHLSLALLLACGPTPCDFTPSHIAHLRFAPNPDPAADVGVSFDDDDSCSGGVPRSTWQSFVDDGQPQYETILIWCDGTWCQDAYVGKTWCVLRSVANAWMDEVCDGGCELEEIGEHPPGEPVYALTCPAGGEP